MEKVEFANGAKMAYTYDNADRPTLIEHKIASNVVKYSIAYAWNTDNTVDQRTETDYTPTTTQTHVTSFTYDHRKRLIAESRVKSKRAALKALITYIENQDARLAYDKFRAAGLDIGSGMVESARKHLLALRMKRSGMRWSKAGSQNVLSIRAAWLNGEWDAVWNNKPLAAA
ncbi:MAG: hypothetical protein JNG88_14835 [Phycisphaerales bacterium]|nr:hypothetical protein [Phycisphaerales bacterium]